jgi:hypothetical protein
MDFTKKTIKTGMIVELENGDRGMVIKGDFPTMLCGHQKMAVINSIGFYAGSMWDENLKTKNRNDRQYDVRKVLMPCLSDFKSMVYRKNLPEIYAGECDE